MNSCVRPASDRGSLTVELVILTPVLLLVVLVVVAFGRVAEADQQVVEAARAGAQVASVQPNGSAAQTDAEREAAVETADPSRTCAVRTVVTDVSHFVPSGYVTVTVACRVPLADLSLPGVPGSTTVQASSTAPIDPYRSVG
jgi:Flp pilus assembly protein TadG